ncbi:putative Fe-S cluster assembly protein SufT [Providencia rettgeri]|uniref:Fe-S cluster assembly protein SufT n=1 Tax=Alcaligenes parafaecalis TaxID=171260 RepID=A0ABT3VJ56_9BURK|nr:MULTISPECIES: putative Fe-S cluster assembly protein SufT [Alcaligenes]MBY6346261.1 putative Fe-S cluster assembly protein SufT [Providencia rettgeri]MCX5463126.1 putative Fe-S cluster assembly protein SufT [Alcaligenes parafaecalis]QTC00605.1 putative Fe-S cluster assembly protein SufT [Alcaligenes sp. SORT26]
MSYFERHDVLVSRDCPAVSIPYGAPVTIESGCTATITQKLGGSYTVMVEGNLYRIEGVDADALGFESQDKPEVFVPELPLSEKTIEDAAWIVLSSVYDPEIPVDIVNLGLVYACHVTQTGPETFSMTMEMTLTAPGCGMGTMIADEARYKLETIQGVEKAVVDLVWDPPWSRERMSESARLQLGML